MALGMGPTRRAQRSEVHHRRVVEAAQPLGVEDDNLAQQRQVLAGLEGLVELLFVLDEEHGRARVFAQVLHLRRGVGGIDAVGDAAATEDGHVHQQPVDDGIRQDRGALAGLEAQTQEAVGDLAHGQGGFVPGPLAPQTELFLPHEHAPAALLRSIPEHRAHGLARHHDVGARLDVVRVPELAHRQVFFFFQRRSPRTPASFMPR